MDGSQETLCKAYIAIWLANRDAYNDGCHFTVQWNTALASKSVWSLLDHEHRIYTRKKIRAEFNGDWKTMDPFDENYRPPSTAFQKSPASRN